MGSWQKKIGAITLFVEDLNRSKSFYQEVFDLQPMFESETDAGFRLEDTFLFLNEVLPGARADRARGRRPPG